MPEQPAEISTTPDKPGPPRKWTTRRVRMLFYLLVLLSIAGWKFLPRPWHPTLTLETAHHTIFSSATRQQTEETAHAMDLLYAAYSNRLGILPQFQPGHAPSK